MVLVLFYRWFAVADRYAIFLYGHLGAGPFDPITRSRYWMTGLAASGVVMMACVLVNGILGSLASVEQRRYHPPAWWRVWLLCAPVLMIGIPLITTGANQPRLPAVDALACVVVALAGLALALVAGFAAGLHPVELVWTFSDGLGLVLPLLLVRALELPARGLISPRVACAAALGGTTAGAIWLMLVTAVRAWRRRPSPGAGAILLSGLCISYLLMPVVHHLVMTPPGYHYITASSNLFADHLGLQLAAFLVGALMALGVTAMRARVGLVGRERR